MSTRMHLQDPALHGWIPVENVLLSNQNPARVLHQQSMPEQHQAIDSSMREKLNVHLKKRMGSPVPNASSSNQGTPTKVKSKKMKRSDSDTEAKEDKCDKSHDRHHKIDLLTSILNQKKASLMHDPEVLNFFRKFVRNQAR